MMLRVKEDGGLPQIVRAFRAHQGLAAKAALGLVTDVLGVSDGVSGPGDDTAAVPLPGTPDGRRRHVLAAGEAMWPPFVARDPYGAGVGAIVANVNDVAAMGGRCLGIVDTIVGPEVVARAVLEGLRDGAAIYDVPVLGGHLTVDDDHVAVSAFAVGITTRVLSARNAAPGQRLLVTCALEGELHPDFPFFASFRARRDEVPGDVEILADLAGDGACVAAKDVSMAGLLGSLAMLLEPTAAGVAVDLDALPRPPHVPLLTWLQVFPSYTFLLCAPPGRVADCTAAFAARGLACAEVGVLDGTGRLRARLGGNEALLLDLAHEPVTALALD